MDNLKSMLSKSQPALTKEGSHQSQPSQAIEEQICIKLPFPYVEYIRDFQHHEALQSGNIRFSFKDAVCSIIDNHKNKHPEIPSRPDIVKAAEKKTGRRKA